MATETSARDATMPTAWGTWIGIMNDPCHLRFLLDRKKFFIISSHGGEWVRSLRPSQAYEVKDLALAGSKDETRRDTDINFSEFQLVHMAAEEKQNVKAKKDGKNGEKETRHRPTNHQL